MDLLFKRFLETSFSELTGLTVDASIPVTESLANELIAIALADNRELEYCRVRIAPENRVDVEIKSPRWPWPFQLKLKLFRSVDFKDSPTLRAFLENNVILGKLSAIFNLLPPGISLYENQISVDLGSFLKTAEERRLLRLVKAVDIRTETGRFMFDLRVER